MLRANGVDNEKWLKLISVPIDMLVGLRYNAVDYSDKFTWDLFSTSSGREPEVFARKTVEDLGLPVDMESAIAFRIRETLLRLIISAAENPDSPEHPFLPSKLSVPSDIVVNLTQPNGTIDMVRNLWSRAKPDHIDTRSVAPQAKLPSNTMSNANTWYTRVVVQETENGGDEHAMDVDVKYDLGQEGNEQSEDRTENVNNSETHVNKDVHVNDLSDPTMGNEVNEVTFDGNEVNNEKNLVEKEDSEATLTETKVNNDTITAENEVSNDVTPAGNTITDEGDEIDIQQEVRESVEGDEKKEDADPLVQAESVGMEIETKHLENQ